MYRTLIAEPSDPPLPAHDAHSPSIVERMWGDDGYVPADAAHAQELNDILGLSDEIAEEVQSKMEHRWIHGHLNEQRTALFLSPPREHSAANGVRGAGIGSWHNADGTLPPPEAAGDLSRADALKPRAGSASPHPPDPCGRGVGLSGNSPAAAPNLDAGDDTGDSGLDLNNGKKRRRLTKKTAGPEFPNKLFDDHCYVKREDIPDYARKCKNLLAARMELCQRLDIVLNDNAQAHQNACADSQFTGSLSELISVSDLERILSGFPTVSQQVRNKKAMIICLVKELYTNLE